MRRPDPAVLGPQAATRADINALNRLFADAFTERYRQDGLTGVRVPWLNQAIWEYAIADAREGAMLWRDARGELLAFNMVHQSGSEGWMGPLAVRQDRQRSGLGQRIVSAGIAWLEERGARTIGLETMPRTIDNIGFYSRLGFVPGHLTVTLQREPVAPSGAPPVRLSQLTPLEQVAMLGECRRLTETVAPGVDFTREIELTLAMRLGDLSLLHGPEGGLRGFALWHTSPLTKGREREEVRVLKLVAVDVDAAVELTRGVERLTPLLGVVMVTIRCQTAQSALFAQLITEGYRVHWTDLRLTFRGKPEPEYRGVMLSNWEI